MRVLVTGASGMLGRAVAQTIERNGHRVTVLQRRPSGLDCAEIQGNITDQQTVDTAVQGRVPLHDEGGWKRSADWQCHVI